MAERVGIQSLGFDRVLIQDILHVPTSNSEQLETIRRALRDAIANELTPRQREVLVMRYYDGLSGCAIAEQLGINPSTVCRTLRRAQERIRKNMRFYFDYRNISTDDT